MLKNVLILLLLDILVLNHPSSGFTYQKIHRNTEICGPHNGHRRYLELGETGEISAHNISVPHVIKALVTVDIEIIGTKSSNLGFWIL